MSNYGRSYYTAVNFREMLSAGNQKRVLQHRVAQSKINLIEFETDNQTATCTFMATNLKPLP